MLNSSVVVDKYKNKFDGEFVSGTVGFGLYPQYSYNDVPYVVRFFTSKRKIFIGKCTQSRPHSST